MTLAGRPSELGMTRSTQGDQLHSYPNTLKSQGKNEGMAEVAERSHPACAQLHSGTLLHLTLLRGSPFLMRDYRNGLGRLHSQTNIITAPWNEMVGGNGAHWDWKLGFAWRELGYANI